MVTSAWADTNVEIGGISYNLNSGDHTASVTYRELVRNNKGQHYYNVNYKYTGDLEIPQSITYNNEKYDVTSIGSNAFNNCGNLTSIQIPNSVTSIGGFAFYNCSNLTTINIPEGVTSIGDRAFNGCSSITTIDIPNSVTSIVTLIGSATFLGCEQLTAINVSGDNANYQSIDGILYNKDLTTLLCYPAAKSGDETFFVPTSVTEIGSYAFAHCKNLTSIIIPSSVSKVGDGVFREGSLKNYCFLGMLDYYEFLYCIPENSIIYICKSEIDKIKDFCPRSVEVNELKFYYPSDVQCKLGAISFNIARNELPEFINSYVSASLTSVKFGDTEITPDENGRYTVSGLNSDTPYGITVTCKMSDGKDFIFTQTESTKKPSITMSRTGRTLTTMTFTVDAESDETCVLTGKGVYVDYEGDYYCTGDKVVVRGLAPNRGYYVTPFAVYGEARVLGDRDWVWYRTASVQPSVTANVGPTSISVIGSYKKGDAHVSETGFTGQGTGNSLLLTGLTPNTSYTVEYYVKTEDGGMETAKEKFTTSKLELTTLQPRCVSSSCAIVAAETNMGDDEVNAGFQWKKYDAPESLKPSEGYAAIYNGQLEGYIKNLQSSSYYNVRAFYKSAEGKYYYGDWVTFDPSDFSYFEPTVHTYAATDVTHNSVRVKGYVLAGTENIDEQGFEYWPVNGSATNALRVQATTKAAVSDVQTVLATGQVMTAELRDLQPETTYCCRAFVRTATGTVYGEEQTFTTEADLTGIDYIVTEEAATPTVTGYYDMLGRKSATPHHGVNIVRYSNGTTRKVFMK